MDARRNVELKARDPDPDATLSAAIAHGATDEGTLHQRDVYFGARDGRLKLRDRGRRRPARRLRARRRRHRAPVRLPPRRRPRPRGDDRRARRDARHHGRGRQAAPAAAVARRAHPPRRRRGARHWVELEAVAPPDSDLARGAREGRRAARGRSASPTTGSSPTGYAAMLLAQGAATDRLVDLARGAMARAYAPYSRLPRRRRPARRGRRPARRRERRERLLPPGPVRGDVRDRRARRGRRPPDRGGRRHGRHRAHHPVRRLPPAPAELGDPGTPVHLAGPEGIRRTLTLGDLLPHSFTKEDL